MEHSFAEEVKQIDAVNPVLFRFEIRNQMGGHTPTEWLSFLLFWGMNIYIIYRGMDLLRAVENWAAPYVLVMTAILLGWAIWRAQGLGSLLRDGIR
jgi:cytosine/uracil/thiamine/allantoin permease